ncbi:MAG: 2-amino-4-hydroxy-6-hydroxymethyldihydropteridine diphosphokinase [Nevskiales bacterium]
MPAQSSAVLAALGLGSNLQQPREQLQRAIESLQVLPLSRLLRISRFYRTPPAGGPSGQDDYCNAAVLLETTLAPLELLAHLQSIEDAQGRDREAAHWGPRTLDLDLLTYGDLLLEHPRLRLPHPALSQRDFALLPLAEIAPELAIPGQGSVKTMADALAAAPLKAWD